ncbi:hypothetical protein SAMN05661012_05675 [Chitinophaga sancti]|uniref:Uncharacterized protein n=1 Tax=Chitinophaga sancti TaxID=1004 RepID=A0A1K1SMU4_9BACT|nr:hypothetical protein SAMN05661012_05675 [Chitinophaga sancti]
MHSIEVNIIFPGSKSLVVLFTDFMEVITARVIAGIPGLMVFISWLSIPVPEIRCKDK